MVNPGVDGCTQWRTQKISEGGAKFRLNRVTSQINFRMTILGGPGACPRENFAKLHLKIRNLHLKLRFYT